VDIRNVGCGEPETYAGDHVSSRNEITGTVAGPSVQAGSIQGDIHINVGARGESVAPAQLLPCRPHFTNRDRELSLLGQLSERVGDQGPPVLIVISGAGGVGKTSLGLCWLHRIRDRFSDGQLFVDLQGFSGDSPMSLSEPLERFLRALGVAAEKIPVDVGEQTALYRSLTARRRLIIMLDNAATAAQVRPLLPGHGPAVVVVTTRRRLSGLAVDGASFLSVGPLDETESVRLLERMLGSDRTGAELDKARSLAALCGGLPLALCTSAARLAVRDRWPIARVVQELADERRRLSAFSTEDDISVQAVFDVSYQTLPPHASRLYRLLGIHPGSDFDVAATAAVADIDRNDAAGLLDVLVGANLLEEDDDERFHFHDLVRLHARSIAEQIESTEERAAGFTRLLDYYLATAVAADLAIIPGRWHLGGYFDREQRVSFTDATTAIGWLESELGNLVAVLKAAHNQELHDVVWQICEALWGLFVFRKHYRVWIDTYQIGLASARACGDMRAQARMLVALAAADLNLRDFAAAAQRGTAALGLEKATDHWIGQASALEVLGVAQLGSQVPESAVESFRQALAINERIDQRRGVAMMTRRLGSAYQQMGRLEEAIEQFTRACQVFSDLQDRYNQARTLAGLADAHVSSGEPGPAHAALVAALALTREIGAQHEQANIHLALGRLAREREDLGAERDHLEQALTIYTDLDAPQAREVRQQLAPQSRGSSRDASGDPPR
jgi:tetratricopeptide (TPR) repeat protein